MSIQLRPIDPKSGGFYHEPAILAGVNNQMQIAQEEIFGVFKQSGNDRDKSLHAFDRYTELKTTWIEFE